MTEIELVKWLMAAPFLGYAISVMIDHYRHTAQ